MFKQTILFLISAMAALAGPPLVCHRIDIGTAQSLPWRNVDGWDGVDSKYNLQNLASDTLRLLEVKTPLKVRMETLRRAAIYSARTEGLADKVSAELLQRTKLNEVEPMMWFDAGYFAEAVRQTGFIYRYDMLSAADRKAWIQRGEKPNVDGRPLIEKAIRLGGKGLEPVLAMAEEYRQADLKFQSAKSAALK